MYAGDEDGQVAIAEPPRIAIVNRSNCQCQHHSLILSEARASRKRSGHAAGLKCEVSWEATYG